MAWILVCVAVVIAAFVMWDSINAELPEILKLPRDAQTLDGSGNTRSTPAAPVINPREWTVVRDAQNLRASREFRTPILAGATRYYPPVMHVSCYGSQLFAWVDSGLSLAPSSTVEGHTEVKLNATRPAQWPMHGTGTVVVPNPHALVQAMTRGPSIDITLEFNEAPAQALTLNTDDDKGLYDYLSNCSQPATAQ